MNLYSYDRTSKVRFESVTGKAAEASQHLAAAYLALHSYKAGLDAMDEIPADLKPLYAQCMKAIDSLMPAQREVHQLVGQTGSTLRRKGL